jgi:hypothetical protein
MRDRLSNFGSSQVLRVASAGLSPLQLWRRATQWLQRPVDRNSLQSSSRSTASVSFPYPWT